MTKDEQRARALQSANQIRLRRAELRREAKAGKVDIADVIESPPDWLLTAQVGMVVEFAPGVGEWRARRILMGLAARTTRVDRLGAATRRRIANRVREMARLPYSEIHAA